MSTFGPGLYLSWLGVVHIRSPLSSATQAAVLVHYYWSEKCCYWWTHFWHLFQSTILAQALGVMPESVQMVSWSSRHLPGNTYHL